MTQFSDFGLDARIVGALAATGYTQPTPIQEKAIPGVMAGRDLLGIAQTGTGKTAAFALPILHRLAANPKPAPRNGCRALVLSPTRELATQIAESFRTYGSKMGLTVATIFGGVGHGPQVKALRLGVDIIVAAPGRLLDHLGERDADLSKLEIFVLDEADQMLDMGFIVPIRKIVKHLPKQRQNLFFSATMPADIGKLASELLNDPLQVSVAPQATTAERVNQQVVMVEAKLKRGLLIELFANPDFKRVLVFTRTKRGADKVARILETAGVNASAIHGNKSQNQRERALAEFKAGSTRALVATDIAARGIDISSVSHVVQYELPDVPEQYVHRIGRTARAGKEGSAVAFCAEDERDLLRQIEKVTRQKIPSLDRRNDAALQALAAASPEPKAEARGEPGQRRGGRGDPRRSGQGQGRSGQGQGRSGQRSGGGGQSSSRPMAATEPFKPKPRSEQAAPAQAAQGQVERMARDGADGRQPRPRNGEGRNGHGRNAETRNAQARNGEGRNGQSRNDQAPRNGTSQKPRGDKSAADAAKKPHRKGDRNVAQGAPRNDVLRVSATKTSGPGPSAADVMKFLSQGR